MFANLNLQLTSVLASSDAGLTDTEGVATTGFQDSEGMLEFSEFFNMSSDEAQQLLTADGEMLPQDGKPLPPIIPIADFTTPDEMIAAGEEPAALPELQLQPATVLPDAEPVDVQLELTLEYTGNPIPAEIPGATPAGTLVLPPGLTLTAINPGMPDIRLVPPEDNRAVPHKVPRPVIQVPPGPPPVMPDERLEVAREGLERAFPQLPVSGLPRPKQARPAPQNPLAAATVRIDTRHAEDLRRFPEQPEIIRQVAAVEPQRLPDPQVISVPPGPPLAAVNLGASPSSVAGELNALRTELPVETISTPVRGPGWGEKLAERVVMFAGVQTKTAEIRLTPAELGPLRVQISVDDGQANVAFLANSAVTREAIEQALPRLREMLAESGLSLGQTDITEQGVAERERDREATQDGSERAQDSALEEHTDGVEDGRQKTVISNGLVDTFA